MVLSIVSCNCDGAWLFLLVVILLAHLAFSALSQSSNFSLYLFCVFLEVSSKLSFQYFATLFLTLNQTSASSLLYCR